MTTNETADPLVIAVDVVSALYVITVRDAAIIISRVRQQEVAAVTDLPFVVRLDQHTSRKPM